MQRKGQSRQSTLSQGELLVCSHSPSPVEQTFHATYVLNRLMQVSVQHIAFMSLQQH